MKTPQHVLVVGAGVFGLAAALELRQRGWSVTVVDPGPLPHPDAASTDISKMIRMDYGADEFYARMAIAAMEGWDRWNTDWDWAPFHQVGFLILSAGPMKPGGYEFESLRVLDGFGAPSQRVDTNAIRQRFPAWASDRYTEGYLSLRAGWAESGRVSTELARQAESLGVIMRIGDSFASFVDDDRGVCGIATAGGTVIRADRVVMATGSWTPFLLPELHEVMWPTSQSVFHLRVDDPTRWSPPAFPPFSADISMSGWYGFPARPDGTLKIAHHGTGRRRHEGDARVVPEEDIQRLHAFLRESLPTLATAPVVHTRVCVYCDTFDGDFWIADHPDRPGVTVASGGNGHGFKFTPVLGDVIADVVEGKANPWAQRFRWRALGAIAREWARSAS